MQVSPSWKQLHTGFRVGGVWSISPLLKCGDSEPSLREPFHGSSSPLALNDCWCLRCHLFQGGIPHLPIPWIVIRGFAIRDW